MYAIGLKLIINFKKKKFEKLKKGIQKKIHFFYFSIKKKNLKIVY